MMVNVPVGTLCALIFGASWSLSSAATSLLWRLKRSAGERQLKAFEETSEGARRAAAICAKNLLKWAPEDGWVRVVATKQGVSLEMSGSGNNINDVPLDLHDHLNPPHHQNRVTRDAGVIH